MHRMGEGDHFNPFVDALNGGGGIILTHLSMHSMGEGGIILTHLSMDWMGEGGSFFVFRLFKSIFSFLLIEFPVIFSSFYEILQYYVYYYCILIRRDGPSGLLFFFVPVLLISILTRLFLPSRIFLYISFLLFPSASVWENTRAWVPHFL